MFRQSRNQLIVAFFLLVVTVLLSTRIFLLVDQYAPTIYFWDRWHTLEPAFNNLGLWESFSFQHGQHRLGLIALLFKMDAWLSGFNARADMFLQAGIYSLTAILALLLKTRLYGKLSWSDVIIPLIFLTPFASDTFTANPFVHGLVPLLAIVFCYAYLINNKAVRAILIAVFLFLSAFTGFALVLIPAILLIELLQIGKLKHGDRSLHVLCLVVGVGSLVYIFTSNRVNESIAEHSLQLLPTIKYAVILIADVFLVDPLPKDISIAVFMIVGILLLMLLLLLRGKLNFHSSSSKAIVILVGASLTFCVLNILGRGHMDVGNAITSRYIPMGMCFALALYFLVLQYDKRWLTLGGSVLLIILLVRVHKRFDERIPNIKQTHNELMEWEKCLKVNYSCYKCAEMVSNKNALHPNPEKVDVQGKLDFLRENNLNIYKD